MSNDDVKIRLSTNQLRELMYRSLTGNYMIVHDPSFRWVQLHPYISPKGERVMDDLARSAGLTQADRAVRAYSAWAAYTAENGESEICDLITDLAHLADVMSDEEDEDAGAAEIIRAETHYNAER